ncbi:hypothetical protein [Lachnoclostridium phytofermentans]|uniref:Uncharacterized protein n=1 Tax=Lachnoclostridium phytofermentans (strain ATCC 700394 / DSM 18823 / ISDg) TaxID=357809 RepID=A9KP02_LACP7|nr:hypothetical protein [Lachnoclostridium phytofermentans]ABX43172.1 hypothetical protein Cphy_2812 [Lachnoclostridium phytofermentans ISDg]
MPGPPTTPDAIIILLDINVVGGTFADSTIALTTQVINNGEAPIQIGLRYLLDYMIDFDDGPTFQQLGPNGPILVNETQFVLPTFEDYEIEDNDVSPNHCCL